MMWHDHDYSGGGWLVMALVMVVFWAVVIGSVLWVARSASRSAGSGRTDAAPSQARHILDERFARGEIDEDEYKRRRATLTS